MPNPVVERRRGEAWTASALIGPATIFIAVCLLAPLAFLFRYSLNDFIAAKKMMVEAVTIANYIKFFTDPYYTAILWTTVRIAVLVTAVCLVLAFPLAYVVARTELPTNSGSTIEMISRFLNRLWVRATT